MKSKKNLITTLIFIAITTFGIISAHGWGGHGWRGWGYGGYGIGLGFGLGWGYPGWGYPYYRYNPYLYSPNYSRYNEADIDREQKRAEFYRQKEERANQRIREADRRIRKAERKKRPPRSSQLSVPIYPTRSKPSYTYEE